MDDWLAGVYIKPFGLAAKEKPYEVSQPHRHDFYYCVLLEKGEIELEVDFQQMQLKDGSVFLSYPGQVHQINKARLEKGWFLAFDPGILDQKLKDILDQCLSEVIRLPLPDGLGGMVAHLYTVYKDTQQLFHATIIQSLVTAFGYQVAAAYLSLEKDHLVKHSNRSIGITKHFRQLLRHHYKTVKKPSEYAAQMNITASYLNDTVKTVTGFSVTYYIQQELMREAQRLLYHSDFSVKEIADQLGFEDEKYFNRLFSKVMGVSPGGFRKKA